MNKTIRWLSSLLFPASICFTNQRLGGDPVGYFWNGSKMTSLNTPVAIAKNEISIAQFIENDYYGQAYKIGV